MRRLLHATAIALIIIVPGSAADAVAPDDDDPVDAADLFMRASVDKRRVMLGEQVTLSFVIYSRINAGNYQLWKDVGVAGFWGEELDRPREIESSTESVQGKQYRADVVRQLAIFPTKPGELEIGPMEVRTTVLVRKDPRDFGEQVYHIVKSEPLQIFVEPFPSDPPPSFNGGVGQFSVSTAVNKNPVHANEPFTLSVSVSGTGNVPLLQAPNLRLPDDFEQYTPTMAHDIHRDRRRITGSKTFSYLLLPRHPGTRMIAPVAFTYFDVVGRKYVTTHSGQIRMTISEVDTANAVDIPDTMHVTGGTAPADIRTVKRDGHLRAAGEFLHQGPVFVGLMAMPLVGLAGAVVVAKRRRLRAGRLRDKNYLASAFAAKGLRSAREILHPAGNSKAIMSRGQKQAFFDELLKALWRYLGRKLDIAPADWSKETLGRAMEARALGPEICSAVNALIEECEMYRFAPGSLDQTMMQRAYDDAQAILITLERTLMQAPQ